MDTKEILGNLSEKLTEISDLVYEAHYLVDEAEEAVETADAPCKEVLLPPVGSIVQVNRYLGEAYPQVGALGRVVVVYPDESAPNIAVDFVREFRQEHDCKGNALHGRWFYASNSHTEDENINSLNILELAN